MSENQTPLPFEPVRTKADLESLNLDEIVEGYMDHKPGDPMPGANRGRAFWHGWCNAARDRGELSLCDASRQLVSEVLHGGSVRRRTEAQIIREAANEIERLRTELEAAKAAMATLIQQETD